jgi:hypothetical protein
VSDLIPRPDLVDLAQRINHEHQQTESALRASLEHARTAGQLLLEAKEKLAHGQWLPWLEANVQASVRSCQAYMRVAREWDRLQAKSATVAHLSYREALAALAEPQPAKRAVRIPMPEFAPNTAYAAWDKLRMVEITPVEGSPGHWFFGIYLDLDTGGAYENDVGTAAVEYSNRGMRLDLVPEGDDSPVLATLLELYGFIPQQWHSTRI